MPRHAHVSVSEETANPGARTSKHDADAGKLNVALKREQRRVVLVRRQRRRQRRHHRHALHVDAKEPLGLLNTYLLPVHRHFHLLVETVELVAVREGLEVRRAAKDPQHPAAPMKNEN